MESRTTEASVTFKHAFSLTGFDVPQPAGTYRVVTEEEQIQGLSFLAYLRVATLLHTPAIGASARHREVFTVDPLELAAAEIADAAGG